MFHVWCGDGEIKWVEECWRHLGEAGLTGNATPLEATATLLRLVTLARVYEEFCGLAWDENPETPVDYLAEDLEIDALALGILAAQAAPDSFDDVAEDYELREAALLAATEAQRQEIFDCLSRAYGGDVQLYSRISRTNRSADDESDGDEFDVTGANATALSYVTNGFRHG
jgi:hypothetical protein